MNKIKKDPFADLFNQLPTEQLPTGFRDHIMAKIQQETVRVRKRDAFWSVVGIAFSVICLLSTAVICFMYINWSFLKGVKIEMDASFWQLPDFSLYIYMFVLVSLLLGLDYLFRKQYRKRMKKNSFESR